MKSPYKTFAIIFLSFSLVISLVSVRFLAQAISRADLETKNIEILSLQDEIKNWKSLYNEVLNIKEEYRKSVKEIADLVYFNNMPIGGQSNVVLKDSDSLTIKMFRNVISSFQDEQEWMNRVKGYLVSRNKFINDFPFIYPIKKDGASTMSSSFGLRPNIISGPKNSIGFHAGVDLAGNIGDKVVATADGAVEYIEYNNATYGRLIILSHNFELRTYYAHLSKISVKTGQKISKGDVIGEVGSSGPSTGPHLHYEIRFRDVPLDPQNFISSNY
jgi:murein DD-endopeptidase MepM/ murein hydrolase activator NlpD